MDQAQKETYYTGEVLQAAARYWEEKDADSVKMEPAALKTMAEDYLRAHNTCALATGGGDHIRCTPIEYSWHDGCFWMFSEGGKKFRGLAENPNVCLAVYDPYQGLGRLHGMQVTGRAELVEPFSREYLDHAAYRKVSVEFLRGLKRPMHLIRVRPVRMECLFSDFKDLGCAPRQTLELEG